MIFPLIHSVEMNLEYSSNDDILIYIQSEISQWEEMTDLLTDQGWVEVVCSQGND